MVDMGDSGATKSLIESLPPTAVQALYHAVTGKTESLSKWLSGNVIIRFADIQRLYQMLREQIDHYDVLANPSVTITILDSNSRKITHSSWEHFEKLQIASKSTTSEISLKIEFITQLPNTSEPQRCVIVINLDSGLPIIERGKGGPIDFPGPGFLSFLTRDWRTVDVSIDFVDYLIAKNFANHVDEWFKSLGQPPRSKMNVFLIKMQRFLGNLASQLGRIGAAVLTLSYVISTWGEAKSIDELMILFSIGLILWSIVQILSMSLMRRLRRKLMSSYIPSVILLTEGDTETYDAACADIASAPSTVASFIFGSIGALGLNVAASYVFIWLHG